jgi:hypothetical protein
MVHPMRALLLPLVLATVTLSNAQLSDKIGKITPDEAIANAPITIQADLRQGGLVDRVFLLYREFGASSYSTLQMDLAGNTASATLPSRAVLPPFVEYYFVIVDRAGKATSYPLGETPDPLTNPPARTLQLAVRSQEETEAQVVFLSPDPGSVNTADDVLVSISLLRADSLVIKRATQVFLDGADVTASAVFSGDLIVLSPENAGRTLGPGMHRINVRLYNRDGNMYRVATLQFIVKGDVQYAVVEAATPGYTSTLSAYTESRNERISDESAWYNRVGYSYAGKYGLWRFVSNGLLTSDEKADRQPQNRFFVGVEHPLFRAGYGDAYPIFPDLILSGKRVRGAHGAARLGAVNLDVTYGSTQRGVEGTLLKQFRGDSLASEQTRDPGATYSQLNDSTWGKILYGTFERTMFAVRPSFGSGETWQFGLTWLSAKDDIASTRFGLRPQENVVLGTDLTLKLDRSRILLTAQAAVSAFNSDISSGNISDKDIGLFFPNDSSTVRKWRDLVSGIITVNQYLRPLSVAKPSTQAYDFSLTLQYFNNVFQARYIFHGVDYTSLGQSFLRRDVQGATLTDRFRLLGNALFLNLGYEQLHDNTVDDKIATTTYSTMSFAVSYYPQGMPMNVSAGFSRYRNLNPLALLGADSLSAVDDATNRVYIQGTHDVTFLTRHTLGLQLSFSDRSDATVRKLDVRNTTLGLLVTTHYKIPLETTLDASLNLNTIPSSLTPGTTMSLNYTSIAAQARYGIITDVLTLSAMAGPTFGDIKRTILNVSAEWYVLPALIATFEFATFQNTGVPSEGYLSLRTRYDL